MTPEQAERIGTLIGRVVAVVILGGLAALALGGAALFVFVGKLAGLGLWAGALVLLVWCCRRAGVPWSELLKRPW